MSLTTNMISGERAGVREWTGLAILALPSLLVSIDVSVMILALPHIAEGLHADSAQQLWIMDIYSFMLAGFTITMGTLGDRIGRRKLLMFGGAAFGLASILAAFSPSANLLIAARALLGIAGATIAPSILALITNMFRNEAQRGFAISVWITTFMAGMTVGPLVGGIMLEHFWWGSVFLLGVPVMLLLLITAPFLLPEYRDAKAGKLDLVSVGLSLVTILPVVYGLKEIAKNGFSAVSLATIAAGIGFGIIFVRRQRHLDHPLLDLKLFANKAFTTAVGGMFLITMTGAVMLFNSQYMQLVLGLSPLMAGIWTLPGVGAMVAVLMVAPMIAQNVRPALVITTGLVISAIGAFLIGFTTAHSGLAYVVIGFALFNGGAAPMVTLANGIVVGAVRPERAGAAAALSETSGNLGFALGIAMLGSIGTMIFRGFIAGRLPQGLPADVAKAASESLAGAVAAAQGLDTGVAGPLLSTAREAFTSGVHAAAWSAAVLMLLVAGLAITRLRHVPRLGSTVRAQHNEEPATEPHMRAARS
jgi:MFS transporter, DHA2 family, multidrug resistance protein